MLSSDLKIRVRELIEPSINRLGFDLVAVEWLGDTRGPILRLSIDSPEGIAARHCAQVSRYVEPLLDEADLVDRAYTLEVSSPGIERPVQRRKDFLRYKGYKARIRLEEGHPRRRYSGTLMGVDELDVLIEVDGEQHRLLFETIQSANLVLSLQEYQELSKRTSEVLHDDE